MGAPKFTSQLAAEYTGLWVTCTPHRDRLGEIDRVGDRLRANQDRYEAVAMRAVYVPWVFIGLVHLMECSLSFSLHLHNGDPLSQRTRNVPAGRPATRGPWTWEESALDALRMKGLQHWKEWTVPGLLFQLERYNGFGYRQYHPEVLSPYLWSGSHHYRQGKYVADGAWSDTAVSKQLGAAVVLRRLCSTGAIALRGLPVEGGLA